MNILKKKNFFNCLVKSFPLVGFAPEKGIVVVHFTLSSLLLEPPIFESPARMFLTIILLSSWMTTNNSLSKQYFLIIIGF